MRRQPSSQKGFTLIEVALAATVLLLGITSMIFAIGMGSGMLDTARKSQIAQQIIDAEINRMRVADWGTGTSGPPGTMSYPADATSYGIVVDQAGMANGIAADDTNKLRFALTNFTSATADDDNKALLDLAKGFTITLNVSTPKTEYRIFTYGVQWSGGSGKPYTRTGVTYLGKYGLAVSYKR